ncbi:hypothetical protein ABIB82_002391 [Bradyrhizobium sp. i1.8.4]
MWERGSLPATIPAQLRRPCRSRHPYAAPRTSLQCVCTWRRNCIEQLSPLPNYALGSAGFPALFQQTAPVRHNRCCTKAANPVGGFLPEGLGGSGREQRFDSGRLSKFQSIALKCSPARVPIRTAPGRQICGCKAVETSGRKRVANAAIGERRNGQRLAGCTAAYHPGKNFFPSVRKRTEARPPIVHSSPRADTR